LRPDDTFDVVRRRRRNPKHIGETFFPSSMLSADTPHEFMGANLTRWIIDPLAIFIGDGVQFFAQHGWLAVIALTVAIAYATWLGYRIYMAFGSCPQCAHRLNRAVDICDRCGCRRHEYGRRP
jgi:hypothetical protein